jgi:hypothetical protein
MSAMHDCAVGRHSTELGTYCLKRLPSTCTVIIVEHSLIVFDKQGCLENEAPRSGMLKVLSRNMRSFRRHKVTSGGMDELSDDTSFPPNLTSSHNNPMKGLSSDEEKSGHSGELEMVGSSPSSLQNDDSLSSPTSVLPSAQQVLTSGVEEFRISFSKRHKQGAQRDSSSMRFGFLLTDQSDDEPAVFSQRTLPQRQTSFSLFMKKLPGDKTSRNRESPGSNAKENSGLTPGWPLMHNAIGFDRKPVLAPGIERSMSVVNWALQLPGRSRHKGSLTLPRGAVEAQCDKLLGELSSKAFTTSMRSPINMGFARTLQENISTLAQQVECLCLERPCTWFSYDQLKAATSNFSPSE